MFNPESLSARDARDAKGKRSLLRRAGSALAVIAALQMEN
jgi:hypothetical protein